MASGLWATFRVAGQLSLLVTASGDLVSKTFLVGSYWRGELDNLLPPISVEPVIVSACVTALSLLVFWASCQRQHQRSVLVGAWALCILPALAEWPMWWLIYRDLHAPAWDGVLAWVISELWRWATLTLLVVGYRCGPTDAQAPAERSRLWFGHILAPLCGLRFLAGLLDWRDDLPIPFMAAWILVAAGLYAQMRRTRPVASAPSWSAVALILTAFTLPSRFWRAFTDTTRFPTATYWTALFVISAAVVIALAARELHRIAALSTPNHKTTTPHCVSTEPQPRNEGISTRPPTRSATGEADGNRGDTHQDR